MTFYSIRELWNGEWWTWYMVTEGTRLEAKPYAFEKDMP